MLQLDCGLLSALEALWQVFCLWSFWERFLLLVFTPLEYFSQSLLSFLTVVLFFSCFNLYIFLFFSTVYDLHILNHPSLFLIFLFTVMLSSTKFISVPSKFPDSHVNKSVPLVTFIQAFCFFMSNSLSRFWLEFLISFVWCCFFDFWWK